MIKTSKRNIHWDYYIALENDIRKLSRYIEFDESNFMVHSIELTRLLLTASSEVDVVLKELCKLTEPDSRAENINAYKNIIKEKFPAIINTGVTCPLYGLSLAPWSNWMDDENPEWWKSYNKVKHERNNNYKSANLNNVLNSVAGLFVCNIHYNHAIFILEHTEYPYDFRHSFSSLNPRAELFRLNDPFLYLGE